MTNDLNWRESALLKESINQKTDISYRAEAEKIFSERKKEAIKEIEQELKETKLLSDIRKNQSKCSHANIAIGDRSEFYRKICIDCGKGISW